MSNWFDFIDSKIIGGAILALFLWLASQSWKRYQTKRNAKYIADWLQCNTENEPGKSHKTVSEVAKNLGLSESEVNEAVAKSHKVCRSQKNPDQVSIWQQEPQSVYEKGGIKRL